jgi:hypothetical protein
LGKNKDQKGFSHFIQSGLILKMGDSFRNTAVKSEPSDSNGVNIYINDKEKENILNE